MGLRAIFSREVLPKRVPPREIPCRTCGKDNELPFAFCEHCGAPRVKLGRFRVTLDLTVTMVAFLATYYFAEVMAWPWALYALFGFLFLQIALMFVAESRVKTSRFALWYMAFFVVGGLVFQELYTEGPYFFVLVAGSLPDIILDNPHIAWPIAGVVLVAGLLPLYLRWVRLYGWVNSYRIVLLSVFAAIAAILVFLEGASAAYANGMFPNLHDALRKLVEEVAPDYSKILRVIAVSVLRVFLFEIFVFAAVRGYAVASHEKAEVDREALARESAFVKSAILLTQIVRRFVHALEQMVHYLFETCYHLVIDLAKVVYAFLRELLFPTLSLVAAVLLTLLMARSTLAYIEQNSVRGVGVLLACILGLFACEMVFLGCKSRYRWSRVVSVHLQIGGWLLPNFLVFFLLISVSLFASSVVLNDEFDAKKFPFFIGLLTKSVGGMLLLVIVLIAFRKRSLFRPSQSAEAVREAKEEPALFESEEPTIEDEEDLEKEDVSAAVDLKELPEEERKRWKRRRWDIGHRAAEVPTRKEEVTKKVTSFLGAAKDAVVTSEIGQSTRKSLDGLKQRAAGKPELVARMEGVQGRLDEKMRQMAGLDKTRESISPEMYEALRVRYSQEAEGIAAERASLQSMVDKEFSENLIELQRLDSKVGELTAKKLELEALYAAGGIPKKDYDSQHRLIEAQIQFEGGALANRRKKNDYLGPWASGMPAGAAGNGDRGTGNGAPQV